MRPLSNCWFVAIYLWMKSRCKFALFTRRSYSFKGVVPHSGVIQHIKGRVFVVIEYKPPLNELWTWRNLLILFSGKYKVTTCRAESVKHFESMSEMRAWVASLSEPPLEP